MMFVRAVRCLVAVACALVAIQPAAAQTTINLPAPGGDCIANGNALKAAVQTLLTNAVPGGIINVPAGDYCFDQPWDNTAVDERAFTATNTIGAVSTVPPGQAVSIEINGTGANALQTVIRRTGSANFRLFNVESGGRLSLRNLTLRDGLAGQGGALRAVGATALTVIDCEVRQNQSFTRGGGFFIDFVGISNLDALQDGVRLANTNFFGNVARNGFGGGVSAERSDVQIEGCFFSCNQALRDSPASQAAADGGGLYFNNGGDPGSFTKRIAIRDNPSPFRRSRFTCNYAQGSGGGAHVNGGTSDFGVDPVTMQPRRFETSADFQGNRADGQGGGLYTQATSVEFNGCVFGGFAPTINCDGGCTAPPIVTTPPGPPLGEANSAPNGGGVMNVTSAAIFRRCKFLGNRAIAPGGGRGGGAVSTGGTNAYIECCFIDNRASEDVAGTVFASSKGGGADAEFGSPLFNDCLFKGNAAANGGGISISGLGKATRALIYNCQITQNVGTVAGGGIAVLGEASPTILHSTIARNLSSLPGTPPPAAGNPRFTSGTGIHAALVQAVPQVINSIVTQNQRGPDAVNGSFSYGYAPALTDTNFRGASAVRASFSFIDVGANTSYPDNLSGGTAGSNIKGCWKPGTTGANREDNDPSFETPYETGGVPGMNVHLLCNSPCIDHANYALSRSILQALIGLASNSPIPEARGQRGEEAAVDISDPSAVAAFISRFLKDYDDSAATTNVENCLDFMTGQNRDNTCRPLQCQSDMGADEARTDIQFSVALTDKVVCLGGRQSFTATAVCPGSVSPPIPVLFTWCRVDRVTCVETVITNGPAYTIVNSPDGTTSTLTINAAAAADNAYFKVKIARGQYFCTSSPTLLGIPTVPLAPFVSCDPQYGCPLASSQARLWVVQPPTASTTGDKTVCSNGSQCLEYTFNWTVLPTTPQLLTCPLGTTETRIPPVACIPTISYTFQAAPSGPNSTPVAFTGNARASITCDPDTLGAPDAEGIRRATRVCRIRFTNPRDTSVPNCDSGRYCATINCGLAADKCQPATACANLCVTPPPTAGGDTNQYVCVSGNQTINLFADFPLPAACATPWCPNPACQPLVTIIKRVTGQPDVVLPQGSTGRVAVTCDAINPNTRRINCRVVITGAQPGDCAQYCIVARCNNLSDNAPCGAETVDKCGEASWCANLCVVDPITVTGEDKVVCRGTGNTQTLNFIVNFPAPPTAGQCGTLCAGFSCTPSIVVSRRNPGGAFITLPQGAGNTRTDTVSGQGTSTTTTVCVPRPANARIYDCTVTVANPNDANCGEYRVTANCSNLTAADKCEGTFTGKLCVIAPPTVTADPTKSVCPLGTQTFNYTAFFPNSPCVTATNPVICPPNTCDPAAIGAVTFIKRTPANVVTSVTKFAPADPIPPELNIFAVCQPPANATVGGVAGRQVNCTLTVRNATEADCAQYCIRATCAGLAAGKCGTAEACSNLCVITPPTFTVDPDKSVCVGNRQTLSFVATFPDSALACTYCTANSCTPTASLFKDGNPYNGDGTRVTATCQPYNAATRSINCTITFTSALAVDCGNYCIRATCGNLVGTGKCGNYERCAKLCVIPNPTVTATDTGNKIVCTGGEQTINFSATFPPTTCVHCPVATCSTPTYEIVRRTSCSETTGGTTIPVFVTPASPPPGTRVWATCSPMDPVTRVVNCRVTVTNAAEGDCGGYFMRATACPEIIGAGKCAYIEACKPLCVVPRPVASGDPTQCVCIGSNQTINLSAFWGNVLCTATGVCPSSTVACTPTVSIIKRVSGQPDQTLTIGQTGRVAVTCDPIANVTGGRRQNCRVVITGAQTGDCAEYCIRAQCSNLATDGKCVASEYCAPLCVRPGPTTSGDPQKYVCVGGQQTIDLYADFPTPDCTYCNAPGVNCCIPTTVVRFRTPAGAETTLPNNVQVGNVRAVCSPLTSGRITCRVTITNATDANCGSFCISATCGDTLTNAGKCGTSTYCAPLCVLRAPVAAVEQSSYCVCVGGCQELRFSATFPAPVCPITNCARANCVPQISIYKLVAGQRQVLTAGPNAGQYVCDPMTPQGVINCRVRIGGSGAECSAVIEDSGRYCMDVTCGELAEGKCGTSTICTDLTVYERPCPSEICDQKVCAGQDLCLPFNFTAPACCQAAITVRRNGVAVTLGSPTDPNARIYITGTGGNRSLCFRNLSDADDGVYDVCVSCTNLVDTKNCTCCERFCLDVLTPPQVTVDHRIRAVCIGQPVDFNFCIRSDLMRCPPQTGPTPPCASTTTCPDPAALTFPTEGGLMRVPVSYRFFKLTGLDAVLPSNDSNCGIGPVESRNFTLTPVPDGTLCGGGSRQFRLSFPAVTAEICGIYRLEISYCGLNPLGDCTDCLYFRIDCQGRICLKDKEKCPGEVLFFCPRFVDTPDCFPDPYELDPERCSSNDPSDPRSCYERERDRVCANPRAQCFTFQWYKEIPAGSGTYVPISTADNPTADDCCLDLGTADESDVGCYRLVATAVTTGDCAGRAPCELTARACFRLKPPDECCWCEECCWDNGMRDESQPNGVLSMIPAHGEFPELRAAADFYLMEGVYHKITKFAGSMLIRQNTALPYKAKLTLFEDCDGKPGEMIDMWDLTEYCLPGGPDSTGLQKVDFRFEFPGEKLWLRGGRTYWWMLQGVSDFNTVNYEAYWVTSELGRIVGRVPQKFEVGVDTDWVDLDLCCIPCEELAFCIECEMCKIIWDNGEPEQCATAGGSRSEKSTSPTRNARAADNFVTPPFGRPSPDTPEGCFEPVDWMVCYVEGYVYTNCTEGNFSVYLDIYRNNCNRPDYVLTGTPLYQFRADSIEAVEPECLATIDGVPNLRLYKVKFCPMGGATYPMGLFLRGGGTYWLSLSVSDGFAQGQRAYFAWNSNDCTDCPIKISPGRELAPGRNINQWTEVGHDFSFLIAAKNVPFDVANPAPVVTANPCPPDINRDGTLSVQDMFDFLTAWFTGCP